MYQFQSIRQYHQALNDNQVTCSEMVDYYLKNIESSKDLNAFVEIFKEESIAKAKELDNKRLKTGPMGRLHGVIISLKDVICYKDHRVTAGSKMLKDFISVYNATVVERLISEDAIIIGTCNCDEFAMGSTNETSVHGAVKNARDKTKVSGGSSGGSAVSVQADLCMISLGSDTGGSVRQPADYCGIVGFKPGYGMVSRYGLIAYASSFDQIGIFAKNAEDIEIVLDIIKGVDEHDSTMNRNDILPIEIKDRPYRIALLKNTLDYPGLDPEIKNALYSMADSMSNKQYVVEEKNFELIEYLVPTYYILTTAEASSNLSRYDGIRYGYRTTEKELPIDSFYKKNRSQGFGLEVKKRIMLGSFVLSEGYFDAYFTKAQQVRKKLVEQTEQLFKEYDFLMLPTVTTTAATLGQMKADPIAMYLSDIYTVIANLTGMPAISLPLFTHSNGMPFGVQFICNKNNDQELLNFSNMVIDNFKVNG